MASFLHNISSQPMLGSILEIIAVDELLTEALLLTSIRGMQRIPGFENSLGMEIGVADAQKSMLQGGRPYVGEEVIDGSDCRTKVPSKSIVTSSEVGECKDAGSDDDEDEDDEDEDEDDEEDDLGDEEDDLSADEGGKDQEGKENNPEDEEEGGEEEANGNEEEDDEDDDDDDDGEEDEDEDEDEDEEDDEEDEEPPAKKK
ncbi:hypothetical protein KI387_026497, partial [Taxus chinensis]